MNKKIYPGSGVELTPFIARHYDGLMNSLSFGLYRVFINKAIRDMNIAANSDILDLGCGTGRNAALMANYLGAEGSITGMDISSEMECQFLSKFSACRQVTFVNQCIDTPFNLEKKFDIVLFLKVWNVNMLSTTSNVIGKKFFLKTGLLISGNIST